MKKGVFGVFFTIIVLTLVVYVLRDIDFFEVYLLFKEINPLYLLLSFFFCLLGILLLNLRFKNSLSEIIKEDYIRLLPFSFLGLFFNTITPGSGFGGGEPIRAYYLGEKYKKPKSKILGSILADKFFNLAVFVFLVVVSLLLVIIYFNIPEITKFILEGILLLLFFVVSLFLYLFFRKHRLDTNAITKNLYKIGILKKKFLNYSKFKKYVNKTLDNFLIIFRKVLVDKKKFYSGIFLSVLIWMFTFLISYFLFLSFRIPINFISVLTVVSLGFFFGDISAFPGGIGVVEGVMFLLYSAMGIFEPVAITVALLSRVIYYFYALLIGGIAFIYLRNTLD